MVAVLLGLAPPWLAAYLLVRWAWPLPPTPERTLFRVSLATGLAVGLSSITFFLWAVCVGPQRPGLPLAELVIFGLLAAVCWRANISSLSPLVGEGEKHPPPQPSPTRGEGERKMPLAGLRLAFGFVLLCAIGVSGWNLRRHPHGEWDAWAIWNLRARFLYRGGEQWTAAFSPHLAWSHPDYPLLVPAAVARGWTYAGQETLLVPWLIACLFGAATVGLLMSVLALLRGPGQGYLGGLVLLATPYFLQLTTAQYADVPLGFFYLAGVVLFEVHDRRTPSPQLSPPPGGEGKVRGPLLAGLLAALASWTKNEGTLFLAVTVLVRLLAAVRNRTYRNVVRELLAFGLGALPILAVLIFFKLFFSPGNDLIAGQGWQAARDRLLDIGRYFVIALDYVTAILLIGPGAVVVLAGYFWLVGPAPAGAHRRIGHAATVLAGMLAGYAVVYLFAPAPLVWYRDGLKIIHEPIWQDLTWLIWSSLHRLLMQLWPAALLAFFLATATPEEARDSRRRDGRAGLAAQTQKQLDHRPDHQHPGQQHTQAEDQDHQAPR
jgi:hypothetical protein